MATLRLIVRIALGLLLLILLFTSLPWLLIVTALLLFIAAIQTRISGSARWLGLTSASLVIPAVIAAVVLLIAGVLGEDRVRTEVRSQVSEDLAARPTPTVTETTTSPAPPARTVTAPAPAPVTVTESATAPPQAATSSTSAPRTSTATPTGSGVYYENCDAVRAAGRAPIRAGQPGYRAGLDRDGDGQGCGDD